MRLGIQSLFERNLCGSHGSQPRVIYTLLNGVRAVLIYTYMMTMLSILHFDNQDVLAILPRPTLRNVLLFFSVRSSPKNSVNYLASDIYSQRKTPKVDVASHLGAVLESQFVSTSLCTHRISGLAPLEEIFPRPG